MGALATAGIISGAGNAMSGSLMETQRGLTAAFMQAEREKFEGERMKMHQDFLHIENEAQRTGQAQEGILNRKQQSDIEQQRQGADIVKQGRQQAFDVQQQGERLQVEEGLAANKDNLERTKLREESALKLEELGIKTKDQLAHQRYYEGIIETYKQGLRGGKGAAGSAMKDLSERDKQMVLVNDKMIDGLQKQLLSPTTTPEQAEDIQEQIEDLYNHSMQVLGQKGFRPVLGPKIVDRHAKKKTGLLETPRTIQERNESLRQGP
jgi:hypothetical protein